MYHNRISIVPTTIRHLAELYRNIRPEDVAECLLSDDRGNVLDDTIELLTSVGTNSLIYTDEKGKKILLGIGSAYDNTLWFIGTKAVEKHSIAFLRYMKELIPCLLDTYKILGNKVWNKNYLHIRWLKWMGAKFIDSDENFLYFVFDSSGGD